MSVPEIVAVLFSDEVPISISSDILPSKLEDGGSRGASSGCMHSEGGSWDTRLLCFWRLVGRTACVTRGLFTVLVLRTGVEMSISEWCFRMLILPGGEGGGAHSLIEGFCMENDKE